MKEEFIVDYNVIQEDVIYLTNILKENNHKYKEVQYSFLNKGYWLLGENLDVFLGENKKKAEQGLLRYIASCK